MLGFWPERSIIVCPVLQGRIECYIRFDIDGLDLMLAAEAMTPALAQFPGHDVLLLGYGPREEVEHALRSVEMLFAPERILEWLATDDDAWWSREGFGGPMPDEHTAKISSLARTVGHAELGSRAEFLARVAGPDEERQRDLAPLVADRLAWAQGLALHDAIRRLRHLVRTGLRAPSIDQVFGDAELVELSVLLGQPDCRDAAWASINQRNAEQSLELWLRVAAHTLVSHAAGPLCMAATAAWLAHEGVVMGACLDRAHRADPDYSLAGLLTNLMRCGVPPSRWQLFLNQLKTEGWAV